MGLVCALAVGALAFGAASADRARWEAGPGATASAAGAPPTRLRISAIGVDTPLEDLGLDANGALKAPADFGRAGWYANGNKPGDVGPAIIAGHVDSRKGPAVFFRLHELRPGDKVEVARGERWVTFRVLAVHRYPKNQFPTDEVYAPTPNPQLRLITCGGAFDNTRRSYLDNVVVYAVAT
jgi:LPXTG-site transpeptidase (sortase) family protein